MDFEVDIDVSGITRLSKALLKINSVALDTAAVTAVNEAAASAYELARSHMNASINLPDAYLQSQMVLTPAVERHPEASITALRRGVRGTTLAPTYGATPTSGAVRWPNGSFKPGAYGRNPRKPGSRLSWKERTGRSAFGIAANAKATGFDVAVKRGELTHFNLSSSGQYWSFLIVVKGQLLAVSRQRGQHGIGAMKALRGPSPWQLFRHVIPVISGQVEDDLTKRLVSEVDYLVGEALEGVSA